MEALLRASRGETPEETPRAVVVDTGTEEMKAGFASFDRGTGFISIDEVKACLLYTSPSPRDMRRSRMPSSA